MIQEVVVNGAVEDDDSYVIVGLESVNDFVELPDHFRAHDVDRGVFDSDTPGGGRGCHLIVLLISWVGGQGRWDEAKAASWSSSSTGRGAATSQWCRSPRRRGRSTGREFDEAAVALPAPIVGGGGLGRKAREHAGLRPLACCPRHSAPSHPGRRSSSRSGIHGPGQLATMRGRSDVATAA